MSLKRKIITVGIINIFVDFLKEHLSTSKLYENVKVSDRFAYDSAMIPCVIIRQTTNTQTRIHFNDLMNDWYNRVQLIQVSGDNNLVGNNAQRVNLPLTIDWNPTWNWDTSIPLPSGSDISQVVFSSGTPPPPFNTTDITTGVIITVPSPSTFLPVSIERAQEFEVMNPWTQETEPTLISGDGTYNLAIGLTGNQYYLLYSGTGMNGTNVIPVKGDDYIINPSGMPKNIAIKMNDVLYAGDQYVINTYSGSPVFVSEKFGGMYDITINFDIYAMSTIEVQELCDLVQEFTVQKKKELWNKYGLTLLTWSKGGESEEAHMNEYIFKASVTTSGRVEWQEDRGLQTISSVIITCIPEASFATNFSTIPNYAEKHKQTVNTSGTFSSNLNNGPVYSIFAAYSGSTNFPPVGAIPNASGSGWFLSGNSIAWTTGSYPDYSVVVPSGWFPASGTDYFVNYYTRQYLPIGVVTNVITTKNPT